MNGDYDPIDSGPPPPRRTLWRRLAIPGIAFLLGLGMMGYLLAHWEGGARLLGVTREAPAAAPEPEPRSAPASPQVQAAPAVPQIAAGVPLTDAELARRLAALEQRFGQIDSSSRVAVGSADRTEALLVAFAARRAIDRGVQLGFLEPMLRQRFAASQGPAVGTIIAAGRQPVTLTQLQGELERLGPQLMGAPPNQSWWGAVQSELGSLIVVRRADTPSSEPVERFDRAKRWLQAGEVAAAVAEVQRMPGQEYGADWVARARRFAIAHQALDAIETAALLEPHAPAQPPPPQVAPTQPRRAVPPARQAARAPARPQPRAQPRAQPARPAPAR
ncbi:MAG: hypothetical protein QOD42_2228 [Sphingomonadales bacterium]|jgi:hypothetical protein|nr:hypothetical protein [Sphingomonadales bacterium]